MQDRDVEKHEQRSKECLKGERKKAGGRWIIKGVFGILHGQRQWLTGDQNKWCRRTSRWSCWRRSALAAGSRNSACCSQGRSAPSATWDSSRPVSFSLPFLLIFERGSPAVSQETGSPRWPLRAPPLSRPASCAFLARKILQCSSLRISLRRAALSRASFAAVPLALGKPLGGRSCALNQSASTDYWRGPTLANLEHEE